MSDRLNPLLVRLLCGYCLIALVMGQRNVAAVAMPVGMLLLVALHRLRRGAIGNR